LQSDRRFKPKIVVLIFQLHKRISNCIFRAELRPFPNQITTLLTEWELDGAEMPGRLVVPAGRQFQQRLSPYKDRREPTTYDWVTIEFEAARRTCTHDQPARRGRRACTPRIGRLQRAYQRYRSLVFLPLHLAF